MTALSKGQGRCDAIAGLELVRWVRLLTKQNAPLHLLNSIFPMLSGPSVAAECEPGNSRLDAPRSVTVCVVRITGVIRTRIQC